MYSAWSSLTSYRAKQVDFSFEYVYVFVDDLHLEIKSALKKHKQAYISSVVDPLESSGFWCLVLNLRDRAP